MNNLHAIDIAVIIGYLILCLVIGLYKAGKIKTVREYTLGTGYISTAVLIFTLFATYIGAGSTVGTVEKLHSMGLMYAIALSTIPVFWVITAKIFGENIDVFKKAGCMSVSDIMQFLYGKPGKWVTNAFSVFMSVAMIAAQISAMGYLFNYFLGISHLQGIAVGFSVLVAYSLFGGIRAVALTDTFQALVLLVAIPVACAIAFHEVGGYSGLIEKLPTSHATIDFTEANILLIASMLFYGLVPVSESTFIQRFLMANDSKQLNKALIILAYISIPFILIMCLIGFVIKVKAPDVNPNTAFFYLIGNYLPVGITGLLISGILAAIMSTADSWLNTTSVLCAHDIAKGLFPKLNDKQELIIARFSVILLAALSVLLAVKGSSLMGLLWLASSFWMPIILIPLAAGFLKFQTSQKSFMTSTVFGFSGVLLGRFITGEFATVGILFGMIGCAIGLFGMHYWQTFTHQKISKNIFANANRANTLYKKKHLPFFAKIKQEKNRYQDYCYLLGALGMVYFLGSTFFMIFSDMRIVYTIVYLKAIAAVLCFGLCIYEFHLSSKLQKKYIPLYWYVTLLYCFPFLSSYIALIYNGSMPWMINLMLSTILLYIFGGWFAMTFLSIIGFCIAYLLFKLTGYSLATLDTGDQPKMLGSIYCFLTGAIVLIMKYRDVLKEKEIESKVLYGAAVAHEVINPLQSASMMADALLKAFKNKKFEEVNKEDFEDIKELLEPFKQNTQAALKTVDRMLTLVRTDISEADDIRVYSINECVESTLKSYGLSEQRLARVNVNKKNSFKFKGSKHFVGHVIANLISNAL
ncbi:MAG: putative periplasmic sensor histidine kinase, partial [Candidatus Midichloriaceae bacterium]|nr:putative periplasmic sensor histidine kinase [Candidatus Midichloriaceae bacterium]